MRSRGGNTTNVASKPHFCPRRSGADRGPDTSENIRTVGTCIAHPAIAIAAQASRTRKSQPVSSYSLQRLGRNTLIYGVGVILSRAASFIMLPLYTRLLDPAHYGVLQLLQMCVEVATITMAAGGAYAINRFFFKAADEAERQEVVTTGMALLIVSHVGASLLLAAAAPWLAQLVLKDAGLSHLIWITAATLALEPLTSVPMALIQIRERPVLYVSFSIGRLITQLSLNILFLVGFGWGVEGILFSSLITTTVFGLILGTWLLHTNGWHFQRSLVRPMLRFGLPYRLHGAGTFVVTFGDRFFLSAASGLAAVGIYGLAYQFGFALIGLVGTPILNAWMPQRWGLVKLGREDRDHAHARTFTIFNLVLISAGVGMSLFAFPLLTVMSDPEYHSATSYIPVILLSQMLLMWAGMAGFGTEVAGKTEFISYATWISVGVILLLYWKLIPAYGPIGAAIATSVSAVVRLLVVARWSDRLWPVAFQWRRQFTLLVVASAFTAVGMLFLGGHGPGIQSLISSILFASYTATIWRTGLVPHELRTLAVALPGRTLARMRRQRIFPAGHGIVQEDMGATTAELAPAKEPTAA